MDGQPPLPPGNVADGRVEAAAADPGVAEKAPAADHIPTYDRLSLVSWGAGSVPSLPSIDDAGSVMSLVRTVDLRLFSLGAC
jgi:hypothetical protein